MAGRYGWDDWTDRIDVEELLDFINRELGRVEVYLSDTDIREALRELKHAAGGHAYFREEELVDRLRSKLKKDRQSGGAQGLYRSRSHFVVCCYVAGRLRSQELAKAMLRFFNRESGDIVHDEIPLLTEWCLGLRQLQGLVGEEKLSRAFHQVASRGPPLFEEWRRPGTHHSWISDILRYFHDELLFDHDRGRDELQVLATHHVPVRRLSVSLPRRRSYLEEPPYPRAVYSSPLLGPRRDLHAIQVHQHLQDWELARLQRNVDYLQRHR